MVKTVYMEQQNVNFVSGYSRVNFSKATYMPANSTFICGVLLKSANDFYIIGNVSEGVENITLAYHNFSTNALSGDCGLLVFYK